MSESKPQSESQAPLTAEKCVYDGPHPGINGERCHGGDVALYRYKSYPNETFLVCANHTHIYKQDPLFEAAPAPGKPTKLEVPIKPGEFSRESPLSPAPSPLRMGAEEFYREHAKEYWAFGPGEIIWKFAEAYAAYILPADQFLPSMMQEEINSAHREIERLREELAKATAPSPRRMGAEELQDRARDIAYPWAAEVGQTELLAAQIVELAKALSAHNLAAQEQEIQELKKARYEDQHLMCHLEGSLEKAPAHSTNTQSPSPLCYCGKLPPGKKCLACQLAALLASD